MSKGIALIAAERKRQVEKEGWTAEHDASHAFGDLALAGCAYALNVVAEENKGTALGREAVDMSESCWPWSEDDWKPTPYDPIRQLVKAGALIAAEIDRRLAGG
jgi:hypothetical protein